MLASLVTLVWFALHSLMRGEFWWSKYNVAAGWFYNTEVYHAGLSWVTLCGASVIILFYCLAGVCYAWGSEVLFRTRSFISAAFYMIGVYFVASYFLWPSFGPFARLWFPWTATVPAQIILLATLARYPVIYVRLLNDFGDPARQQPKSDTHSAQAHPPDAHSGNPHNAASSAESAKD